MEQALKSVPGLVECERCSFVFVQKVGCLHCKVERKHCKNKKEQRKERRAALAPLAKPTAKPKSRAQHGDQINPMSETKSATAETAFGTDMDRHLVALQVAAFSGMLNQLEETLTNLLKGTSKTIYGPNPFIEGEIEKQTADLFSLMMPTSLKEEAGKVICANLNLNKNLNSH